MIRLDSKVLAPRPALPRLHGWRATPRSFLIATAMLVTLFGVGFWAMFLWTDYRRELSAAQAYGEGVLDTLSEHMRRLVATNDVMVQQLLRMLTENGVEPYRDNEAEWRKLRDLAALPQQTSILTVLDRSGEVLVSSRGFGPGTPKLSLAEHSFFKAHRAGEVDGLLIGPTLFIDGKPFLAFTRRWQDEDGTFLGVVGAAVRADDFLDFAERLAFGPRSAVSVIRDDGLVLVRRPLTAEVVQMSLNDYELFTEHLPRGPQGSYDAISPADGEVRIVFYRRLEDLPLIMVTGLARREVLADWRRHAYQTGALVLVAVAGIGGLALFGSRYAAREEEALRELAASREHERLLLAEVDHRAKNMLAIVQSLVRQTARTSADKQALELALTGRLQALASAHDLLSAEKWTAVDLRTLVERGLRPFAAAGRVELDGEHLRVPAKAAVTLGMVIHELATNATKHGALSGAAGRVAVSWRLEGGERPTLRLAWTEAGGPPVRPPQRKGFGTTLLERSLAHDLDGALDLDYRPDGLRAEMTVPLEPESAPAGAAPADPE